MSVEMKLQQVPARRGAVWVRQGFRVFALRPVAFSFLLATFLFGMVLLLAVPLLGPLLLMGSLPLVSLVFMLAAQVALRGQTPTPALFAVPFRTGRPRTRAMLQLGALYALGSVAIVVLSHWVDGGRFAQLQELIRIDTDQARAQVDTLLQDPALQAGVVLRFTLAALLSLPFWHAPALVHWAGHSAAKSIFFSTVAVWRNKAAFVVYGLTCAGALLAFGMAASLLLAAIGQPGWAGLIVMPAGLLFATVFYASLFFTFIDSFEASIPLPPET